MDLRSMLQQGPGQLLELMRQPDVTRLTETLVAMANADGGTILIGVASSGRVGMVDTDDVEASLMRAQMRCRPPVRVEWNELDTGRGPVISVMVPRSETFHTLDDGRILMRSGARNRVLAGEEIRQLAISRGTSSFEESVVAGATMDDLNPEVIAAFEAQRLERAPRGERVDSAQLLFQSGAMTSAKEVTVAGMLLFGRDPQVFLPQSGVVFVRFPGTQISGSEVNAGYARREEINGPMHQVVERSWQVIWEEMRRESLLRNGLARQERLEYPEVSVREALVNAVAHRDYRLTGRRIEVRMFDDRLEIISPGGLPGHITLDNIVEEHFSRNPRLVRGLFHWGYIEELGIGVDRMIDAMVRAGHPAPRFDAKPYRFTVMLKNVQERRPPRKWEQNLNERQIRAMAYLEEHGRITNRAYRGLYPDVSAETVRLDLVDLVDKGLLLKVGAKRGTYYIPK